MLSRILNMLRNEKVHSAPASRLSVVSRTMEETSADRKRKGKRNGSKQAGAQGGGGTALRDLRIHQKIPIIRHALGDEWNDEHQQSDVTFQGTRISLSSRTWAVPVSRSLAEPPQETVKLRRIQSCVPSCPLWFSCSLSLSAVCLRAGKEMVTASLPSPPSSRCPSLYPLAWRRIGRKRWSTRLHWE